ncbi:MoaD/ThiS family protein [Effusibacillus lacus]|uniref:Molybdopterin synthase sulfur carrier subunit n=1 Tax=Effusibacillus lacus TaxID=1348429 RepID=A0A292YG86_9BACL|nr:MoaD/ThiS family protein [Effusibacillus lacus]TCS67763.1 sulfur carrier protein ThiS [Effusibacillus lacus]GAX89437.1 molybdopterin synthase sulfur carrier subunit [Effusibacillus lacus]
MRITIQSFIPWMQELNGEHQIGEGTTIFELLQQLKLEWDRDVLVAINDRIAKADDVLTQGDLVVLLVPLTGG